mmetsp:Transcript_19679/g.43787  ORF Transcript_19679/g.43787 Transcript_19679/m.43787 type:complete len:83 (+) Transcript_19679:416-664(+)
MLYRAAITHYSMMSVFGVSVAQLLASAGCVFSCASAVVLVEFGWDHQAGTMYPSAAPQTRHRRMERNHPERAAIIAWGQWSV